MVTETSPGRYIVRMGERLTFSQQMSRAGMEFRGRPLSLGSVYAPQDFRNNRASDMLPDLRGLARRVHVPFNVDIRAWTPLGKDMSSLAYNDPNPYYYYCETKVPYLDYMAAKIDRKALASRPSFVPNPEIAIPEFIGIPGNSFKTNPFNIMRGELRVSEFRQFVESSKYVISGVYGSYSDQANRLLALLDSPSQNDPLSCLSLFDGREYAEWLSDETGRNFSVPTKMEWLLGIEMIGKTLTGEHLEWMDTKVSADNGGDRYVLRSRKYPGTLSDYSMSRSGSVRLVEAVCGT